MPKTNRFYLRLDPSLKAALDDLAARTYRTASDLAREAIRRYVDNPRNIVHAVISPEGRTQALFTTYEDAVTYVTNLLGDVHIVGDEWYFLDEDGEASVSGFIRQMQIRGG